MLKQTLSTLAVFLCLQCSVNAQTFFVKQDGSGNGTSWENASGDLQLILSKATFGSTIWVAKGTYLPTNCTICQDEERSISFVIPDGVKLLGGFKGNETREKQRDWQNHPTTLSGNIGRQGNADNSYTVVTTKNVSNKTVIDGFIIAEGNANGSATPGDPSRSGGGWYNDGSGFGNNSSPFIMNCVFLENYALEGAGFFNNGQGGTATPTLTSCIFTLNQSIFGGGGIFNHTRNSLGQPTIDNCQFVDNTAAFGAGIFTACPEDDVEPIVDHCIFVNNKAQRGSGMFFLGLSYRPTLRTNRFHNNSAMEDADVFIMKGKEITDELLANLGISDMVGM